MEFNQNLFQTKRNMKKLLQYTTEQVPAHGETSLAETETSMQRKSCNCRNDASVPGRLACVVRTFPGHPSFWSSPPCAPPAKLSLPLHPSPLSIGLLPRSPLSGKALGSLDLQGLPCSSPPPCQHCHSHRLPAVRPHTDRLSKPPSPVTFLLRAGRRVRSIRRDRVGAGCILFLSYTSHGVPRSRGVVSVLKGRGMIGAL